MIDSKDYRFFDLTKDVLLYFQNYFLKHIPVIEMIKYIFSVQRN